MSTTSYDAYQEVLALVSVGINEAMSAVTGHISSPLTVRWPYATRPEKPPSNGVWCEVYIGTDSERQSALSAQVGDDGCRVFDATGTVGVIVRVPTSVTNVPMWYIKFASKLRNTFRKATTGNVWYRNSRISDNLNVEDNYYVFSVVSEFTFSEIV